MQLNCFCLYQVRAGALCYGCRERGHWVQLGHPGVNRATSSTAGSCSGLVSNAAHSQPSCSLISSLQSEESKMTRDITPLAIKPRVPLIMLAWSLCIDLLTTQNPYLIYLTKAKIFGFPHQWLPALFCFVFYLFCNSLCLDAEAKLFSFSLWFSFIYSVMFCWVVSSTVGQ